MIAWIVAVTLGGLAAGRLVGWMVEERRRARAAGAPFEGARPAAKDPRLAGLECGLGDVVVLPSGEEAWLAGAIVLRERAPALDGARDPERTVAALFVAPERGVDRAVYARIAPRTLDWMRRVPVPSVGVGSEPPSILEHEGDRFERVRRIPVAVCTAGDGAPELGAEAIVGEYDGGAGMTLLVIKGARETAIWRGHRLEEGMYDLLPAG